MMDIGAVIIDPDLTYDAGCIVAHDGNSFVKYSVKIYPPVLGDPLNSIMFSSFNIWIYLLAVLVETCMVFARSSVLGFSTLYIAIAISTSFCFTPSLTSLITPSLIPLFTVSITGPLTVPLTVPSDTVNLVIIFTSNGIIILKLLPSINCGILPGE